MKKIWKFTGVIAFLAGVLAFAGATAAYAQGPNPPDGIIPQQRNQLQNKTSAGLGLKAVDESTMHAAIADALNLTVAEFETAAAEGKTPALLAQELGFDFSEVTAAMAGVHDAALQQSVDTGLIPQAQADWIAGHPGGQSRGLATPAAAGPRGNGSTGNNGDCLYQTP